MYEIDTKTGGNDMATLYRGVDTTLENTDRDEGPVSVLYRGVKHTAIKNESTQSGEGIYRGTKWVA